jgi:hypothetical protein
VIPGFTLSLSASTVFACSGTAVTLTALAEDFISLPMGYDFVYITSPDNDAIPDHNRGLEHHYQLNTGQTIDQLIVYPTQTTIYTVYATNGSSVQHASIKIEVPTIKIENEYRFCTSLNTIIDLGLPPSSNLTGSYSYQWSRDGVYATTTNTPNTTITFPNDESANFLLGLVLIYSDGTNTCYSEHESKIIVAECCVPSGASNFVVVPTNSKTRDVLNLTASQIIYRDGLKVKIVCDVDHPGFIFHGKSYIEDIDKTGGSTALQFNEEVEIENCTIYFNYVFKKCRKQLTWSTT